MLGRYHCIALLLLPLLLNIGGIVAIPTSDIETIASQERAIAPITEPRSLSIIESRSTDLEPRNFFGNLFSALGEIFNGIGDLLGAIGDFLNNGGYARRVRRSDSNPLDVIENCQQRASEISKLLIAVNPDADSANDVSTALKSAYAQTEQMFVLLYDLRPDVSGYVLHMVENSINKLTYVSGEINYGLSRV